jgi:hypothetical protein
LVFLGKAAPTSWATGRVVIPTCSRANETNASITVTLVEAGCGGASKVSLPLAAVAAVRHWPDATRSFAVSIATADVEVGLRCASADELERLSDAIHDARQHHRRAIAFKMAMAA